jgi:hypothetical protein
MKSDQLDRSLSHLEVDRVCPSSLQHLWRFFPQATVFHPEDRTADMSQLFHIRTGQEDRDAPLL